MGFERQKGNNMARIDQMRSTAAAYAIVRQISLHDLGEFCGFDDCDRCNREMDRRAKAARTEAGENANPFYRRIMQARPRRKG